MTTRRGLLISTALGWAAGQLGPGPRPLDGARLGASHARGHLLRDGGWAAPSGVSHDVDVVIVGGGVSGLSAAWRLAPLGLSVLVLELEPTLGGTSSWGEDGVVPHPWGAHYLPAPNLEAKPTLRLLERMGTITSWDAAGRPVFDRRALCHAPEDRVFYRGAWHHGLVPTAALERHELEEVERFTDTVESMSAVVDGDRHRFQIPISLSSTAPDALALDELSMADWLTREGFQTEFLRWFVRYATQDDFGADPDDVSAWAGLHYFAARRLKTDQLQGSHYLVWPEGNGRLVKALLDQAKPSTQSGALALAVRRDQGRTLVDWMDATSGRVATVRARGAVLAAPSFIARRLFAHGSYPERKSSPWLVANLHVERDRLEPDHPWDSVIYGSAGLGYVDASHQLTPPQKRTVLTYFRAFGRPDVSAARRDLEQRPWESLAQDVLDDLAPAHPFLRERVERMDFVVWGHAMPRPTVGFLRRGQPALVSLAPGVVWGHVDQAGIALFEEAQWAGVRAAERLLPDLGLPLSESWLG